MPCLVNGPCLPYISQLELCCLTPSGSLPEPCILNGEPVPQDTIDNALQSASELLWTMTGRQFGVCEVTVRPCNRKTCSPCPGVPAFDYPFAYGYGGYPWLPFHTEAGWINIPSSGCKGCCDVCEVGLPYPVCEVSLVKQNGVILGNHLYRIDNFKTLVRLPGGTVNTPLTSLNTVAADDPDTPTIQVSLTPGPGLPPVYPNPTTIGSRPGSPACGVHLPSENSTYEFLWSTNGSAFRRDIQAVVCLPLGVNHSFSVGGTGNGPIQVIPESGCTEEDITVVGNTVTVFRNSITNEALCVRVLVRNVAEFQAIYFTPVSTGGDGIAICEIGWSDLSASGQCWPDCQNLSLPDTEDDTFSVTLQYGIEPPSLVKQATAELACQLIKACVGQPCQLPQRVQSISRQGVTMALLDPMDFLTKGMTGIYIVDLAINAYNPRHLPRRPSVWSPDVDPEWRRTTGG